MAVDFPSSPSDGQKLSAADALHVYKSSKGYWKSTPTTSGIQLASLGVTAPADASGSGGLSYNNTTGDFTYTPPVLSAGFGATVYATAADLPLSGNTAGDQAYVTATNRLYLWTGTGWHNIALINTSPTITTGGAATYELATDGTATVITLAATDPEEVPITWSYAVTTGSLGSTATVSQSDNVFTITPSTVEANAGTFSLTFTASDGVNTDTSTSAFTLAFSGDWSSASQQAKIQASDKQASDFFGGAVSISNDGSTAIVGAKNEDPNNQSNAGAAYIFTRSGTTWSQQAKILAGDIGQNDTFGGAVSISSDGDTAIVGSPREGTGGAYAGAAYIFTRSGTTWSQQRKIQASDKQGSDYFGEAVAISSDGDTVIVGAKNEDTGAMDAGSAYIFTRSGTSWPQQAKLQASDRQQSDYFGNSVSLSSDGSTAIVGSYLEDTGGTSAGSVYIFTRSGTTWSQQVKIQSSDIEAGDRFGDKVAISSDGNTAIVGTYFHEDAGEINTGAAYIFTRSGTTWSQQAKIKASDAEDSDNLAISVAISSDGNAVILGASGEDTGGSSAGAAYIFTRSGTTWSQQAKIQSSDVEAGDSFGRAVDISDDASAAIIGALYEDTGDSNVGAAYIFIAG